MDRDRIALIFAGGEGPGPATVAELAARCAETIAADGGFDLALARGVVPAHLVGDLDSVRVSVGPGGEWRHPGSGTLVHIHRHPRDKDWSDTELALSLARGIGCGRAIVCGGGGGRLDHLLAVAALFHRPDAPWRWYTASEEVLLIDRPIRLAARPGSIISLFPLGGGPCRARSTGLRWPLEGLTWGAGDFGLSNEAADCVQTVEPVEGRLLLVRPRADTDSVTEF